MSMSLIRKRKVRELACALVVCCRNLITGGHVHLVPQVPSGWGWGICRVLPRNSLHITNEKTKVITIAKEWVLQFRGTEFGNRNSKR